MGVVISVNVGLPRDVQWRGTTVRTAIWKQSVAGRVVVGRLNLAGDGQADLAGHGGERRAVMVYQLDSYRYWERHLGRSDFVYGQFGENLTVDGPADSEVCIGDHLRIGSAVFEVTQPRVTCYKRIRMDNPELPALLVSHRRPGFYCKVIIEGEIGAGDQIVRIARGPEQMTVAEIDALLYLPPHPIEALRRALRLSVMGPGWLGSFQALLTAAEKEGQTGNAGLAASPTIRPLWQGFRRLMVIATTQESEDVRSFVLAAEDGSRLPDPLPGQHIIVKLQTKPGGPTVTRLYSLCGPPKAGTYRIGVKHEVEGVASGFLHQRVGIGDILQASAPRGDFTLASGTGPVVLLSAGIGVTPVLAMLRAVAAADAVSPRDVWWVHGARDGAHHSFAREIDALIGALGHGRSSIRYSQPKDGDQPGRDFDVAGHLDVSLLRQLGVPADADYYLCGPIGFLQAVGAGLKSSGVAEARIHTEIFGSAASLAPYVVSPGHQAPHLPTGAPGTGPIVTFARSGLAVPWDTRFRSLLELAEACDVPARWSCRTGVCHNCECALIEGDVRYAPDPLDPPADGNVLICCASPLSDVQLNL